MVPEGRMVFADQTVEDNLVLGGYLRLGKDNAGVKGGSRARARPVPGAAASG